ncbi:acyl dehydratase MaoC [Natrialba chahannaoensis JCM 10990]|uniref:Acyl dehydratase MaoC n=1 Tax=Natrialba chahannaoensis JCM 10990 TaxID=1227492 RepID=M0AKF2_9EURY|nr:acyl dehydratase MaoC [Natrialba chahannaoensis JCM 10990]
MAFHLPVQIDDRVTGTVEVVEELGDSKYCLSTTVRNTTQEKLALEGEAVVLMDK